MFVKVFKVYRTKGLHYNKRKKKNKKKLKIKKNKKKKMKEKRDFWLINGLGLEGVRIVEICLLVFQRACIIVICFLAL